MTVQKIDKFTKPALSQQRKIIELKIAFFIAEHTSIKTVDHLSVLLKKLDPQSQVLNEIQLHRSKCTALIKNNLSPCIVNDLLTDVGESFYSLIVDESTAVDQKKLLCIVIRYLSVKKEKMVTTFYRLIEMSSGTSDAIASAITTQLKTDGLRIDKFVGLGVDGASVNVGEKHSLTTLLHEINPHIVVIKCICHSLHLAAEKACETLPRHLDYMVRETHNWFAHSTKRQIEYAKLYKTITDSEPKKIVKLSDTRWLVRDKAIFTILEQYDPLKLLFKLAESKEKCYTARQLAAMYDSVDNRLFLTFIHSILKPVINLNMQFQSDKADPIKLFSDLNDLFYSILQKIVVPAQLEKVHRTKFHSFEFSRFLMPVDCIHFGYEFNQKQGELKKETIDYVKVRCRDFLVELANELQKRLPSNIHILEKISLFSQENASSQIKPDIREVAEFLKHVCGDVDETIRQWNILHRLEVSPKKNVVDYWLEVYKVKNAAGERKFENICQLSFALMSLPISNAGVERVFSIVNIIKDKIRNKLAVIMVEAILHVRCTSQIECTDFFPTDVMLKKFNSEDMYTKVSESDVSVLDIFPLE